MPTYRLITAERDDGIFRVTINRPDVLNALNAATREELSSAAAEFAADDSLGTMLLAGVGERAFCAGQDLEESRDFTAEAALRWIDEFDAFYAAIRSLDKPVVARIQGWATGAGFQLALLADVRVGGPGATFAMTELDVGIPCVTGFFLLERVVGFARAAELTLSARRLEAEEALRCGVLTHLVPRDRLDDGAVAQARALAAKPPVAMGIQKRHLRALSEAGYQEMIRQAAAAHAEAFGSGEPQRIMAEFIARRGQAGRDL